MTEGVGEGEMPEVGGDEGFQACLCPFVETFEQVQGEGVLDACAMSMLTPSKRGNAIVISEALPGRCEISDGVDEILPFSRTSERILKLTSNQSIQQGFPVPEGGLLSDRVDRDLSFCTIHGDKIKAYVTAEDRGDNMVEISSLWSGIDNPVVLLAMLIKVIDALRERYSPDTRIAMLSTNERADKLIEYVFRHVEQCSYRMVKI